MLGRIEALNRGQKEAWTMWRRSSDAVKPVARRGEVTLQSNRSEQLRESSLQTAIERTDRVLSLLNLFMDISEARTAPCVETEEGNCQMLADGSRTYQ